MTDITFITQYIDIVTLGGCLCVGYALKNAKIFERLGNQYIPLIMLLLGLFFNVAIHWGNITPEILLGGMISGLASTGFHEMLRNLIDKNGTGSEES